MMTGEPYEFPWGGFLIILSWLVGFPFVSAVMTGGVAGWLLKGMGLWPGLWAGCGMGVLNPFLGFLGMWMYWERVYRGPFEIAILCHAAGVALGCAVLVGLLYAQGRANIRAQERRRRRRRPIP